jgi:thiol-disulfide isomerase/thioredoxin
LSKPYRCGRCGLAFTSKKGLGDHIKVKHRTYYYSVRIIPVLLAIIILAASVYAYPRLFPPNPVQSAWDTPVPVVTGEGLTGDSVKLSSIKGRPALIEFMVSWCGHCQNMASYMEDLFNRYNGSIAFMSVAGTWSGANADTTAEFINKYNVSWTHVFDGTRAIFNYFNITQTPTYIFFNSKGEQVQRIVGEVSPERLADELERLG